jgi:hypothetical protein
MKEEIEELAKEYAEQFRDWHSPITSSILVTDAKRDFKAGYQAGKQAKEKEIVDRLKEITKDSKSIYMMWSDVVNLRNELENLSK